MKISKKDWQNYIDRLRRINEKAAGKVAVFMEKHDCSTPEGMKLLIDYAHAVATKYGEGAAELSCQMLDAVADASNAYVPAAEPAVTATYGEIARTIYGTMAKTRNPQAVGAAIGRSVKLASVDTLQQNALRNGAEWAWIPSGDTCAYCLMLASRGWVKASAKAIKNGHAEHIHNNCDCTYCVRYDKDTTVEGYDPDALYDEYINAGDTKQERINALRRQHYATNRDYINAQKRAAYARKMRSEGSIVWPKGGTKLTSEEFKELRSYAESKGLKIAGIKDSTIDRELAKDVIDRASEIVDYYGLSSRMQHPFTVDFSSALRSVDFAESFPDTHHIVYFNKDAYRSAEALKKEYAILEESGFFVKGTDYRAIVYHEMGHIIGDIYGIDSMKIAKKILGMNDEADVLDYLREALSIYSSKVGGDEIIAECFSAVYSGVDNSFALKFVEECDKIINASRR